MNTLTQFFQQFRTAWTNSGAAQRALLLGAVSLVIIGMGSVVFFAGRGDMAVLYAGLSETDAGAVVEALRSRNVPYRLNETGSTIEVPRQRVAETRLALAQEGLPNSTGVGFELFDRSEFGITDFAQKVNFKRAVEGELARTINQLQEVKYSRVQLVMPERRLFGRDQAEPSAAVFLSVHPGRSLDRSQVRAVQHLVASSVEGLRPDNITITDQFAHALAAPSIAGDTAALSASQLEVRRSVERSLADKVDSILARVVGPNRSAVAVTASIDFDRVERTSETFNPAGQVVRSEQRQSEKTTSTEPAQGGVVGVTANLPTATNAGATGGGAGQSKKSDTTITNYEIDSTVEHIVRAPSTIKALSVSVVVDGTYTLADDGVTKEYKPRDEEEMANLKRLVAAAVGHDDVTTVEVLNVPLDTSGEEAAVMAEQDARRQQLTELGFRIARIMLVVIIAFVAFGTLRRIVASIASARPATMPSEGTSQLGGVLDLMAAPATETETRAAQLQQMSRERPEDLAALLRSWLVER